MVANATTTPAATVVPVVQTATSTVVEIPVDPCSRYLSEFAKYDWNVNIVKEVSRKESGCDPTNHNWKDNHRHYKTGQTICFGSWSLMNVGCIHYKAGEDINNPALNVEKAYKIYLERGRSFGAWTTCAKVPGCF